eukprot:gene12289-12425_t
MQINSPGAAYGPAAGRGAYGSVFKALDKFTGEVVAIKVISTTDSDADDLERIHKE